MSDHSQIDEMVHELSEGRLDRATFLRRATAAGLSVSAATALAASAGPALAERMASGGTLKIRAQSDFQNMDPAFVPGVNEGTVMTNVYEGLVGFKPGTFQLVPVLAETWTPSKDGLRYDFTLRKGVQFHGGFGEVTANDVKYSYERIAGLTTPAIKSPYASDWAALQEVKVNSKYSGSILLKNKFAPLLTSTLPGSDGYIVSQKAIESITDYAHHPIGTGPYQFTSWTPGQQLVLSKNPSYQGAWYKHAKPVVWDQIVFIPIALSNSNMIALQSGAVDWAAVGPDILDAFTNNASYRVEARTTLNYSWLGMNLQNASLKDMNVRQAIRYAVDVPAIHKAAFLGKWTRARAILPPGMPIGYWPQAPLYKRDVAKAQGFLKKSGQSNLSFTMAVKSTDVGAAQIAQIVQSNLQDIGIKVQVLVQDRSVFNQLGGAAQQARQLFYEVFSNPVPEPSFSTEWFTCGMVNVWNWMSWCNRQFSDWDTLAAKTLNPETRSKLYIDMQKIWDKKANVVWVAFPQNFYAGKKNIIPSLTPSGGVTPWDFRLAS
jgi:peptide/nickel transport system substrate-binding protein